jgi:poly(3-hydroxybutyrate) depolymerase
VANNIFTTLALLALVPALAACGSDDSSGETEGAGGPPKPAAEFLPVATGTCPGFAEGAGCTVDSISMICDFSPSGLVPRKVRIWMSEAARSQDGPLIVFWHGLTRTASDAAGAAVGLGPDVVAEVVTAGGIVAAPERSEKRETPALGQLPWLLALGTGEDDDLRVMDEVVACARSEVGIDLRRIHTTGMSAGGLQTGQVGARRSGYLASTVVFSGGQAADPPIQDPSNLYAVALFHGGPQDVVLINFMDQETMYRERLNSQGHFNIICNHGANHSIPPAAAMAGWVFMQDHPYGVSPEPYAGGLPASMPAYCEK